MRPLSISAIFNRTTSDTPSARRVPGVTSAIGFCPSPIVMLRLSPSSTASRSPGGITVVASRSSRIAGPAIPVAGPQGIAVRGHEGPKSLARDATLLCARGGEIRPILQPFPRSVGAGGGADYPIHLLSSYMSWAGFNVAVCALRFFYGVTRAFRDGRSHPLCAQAAATAGDPERG